MKSFSKFSFFLLAILVFTSCIKEDLPSEFYQIPDEGLIDSQFQLENFGNPTTANFFGSIKDQSGQYLEGVEINIGNLSAFTDRNGIFVLNNADVFENFAYVKAKKNGYLDGSRVVIPKKNGSNRIDIVLLKKEVRATINSGETSEVEIDFGVKVSFPGKFITENGNPYNGPVDVVTYYLSPEDSRTMGRMPGALYAQNSSNNARILETFGMVTVNLFTPSGQILNINKNNPATLEFPITFSKIGDAPETIELWYFDEDLGYWKEDGLATKDGNKYIAEVSHFSWWNVDIQLDFVQFDFTLSPNDNEIPIQYEVLIQRKINNQILFLGIVKANEKMYGQVPKNEELIVSIYGISGICSNQLIHSEIIGGYATNSSVNISFADSNSYTNIQGTVSRCSGDPLSNGYLYIDGSQVISIIDGNIDLGIPHCVNQQVTLQIYDSETNLWEIIDNIQLNGGSIDIGNLSTCDNTGGIFNGSIALTTQEEVNSFGLLGYTQINGSLFIGSSDARTSNVSDLTPLSSITKISGRLSIDNNGNLTNITGLENLTSIWWLRVVNNAELIDLEGFQSLESEFYRLEINNNKELTSISSLNNSTTISSLEIRDNDKLISLNGINVKEEIVWIDIFNNSSITSLEGLEDLRSVSWLIIGGNDSLKSLDGLENLISISGLHIGWEVNGDSIIGSTSSGNLILDDFCALQNLLNNGSYPSPPFGDWGVRIDFNLYNPTVQNIKDGDCSL